MSRNPAADAWEMTDARRHSLGGVRAGAAIPFPIVNDADAPVRLQRARHIREQTYRIFHLVECVDDQHSVCPCVRRQLWIVVFPQDGCHVVQSLTFDASLYRFDHQALHVDCIHPAEPSDTARETHREPSAPGAEIRDGRPFCDAKRVHDLVRFLPRLTIGRLEQTQVLRCE